MIIHLHLIVSHASVIGAFATLAVLVVAYRTSLEPVHRLALGFLIVTAVSAAVSFFSGPRAYDLLLAADPSVEKAFIEDHAVLGNAAFITLVLVGVVGVTAFTSRDRGEPPSKALQWLLIAGVVLACLLLAWAAYLGGLIRHPEIR